MALRKSKRKVNTSMRLISNGTQCMLVMNPNAAAAPCLTVPWLVPLFLPWPAADLPISIEQVSMPLFPFFPSLPFLLPCPSTAVQRSIKERVLATGCALSHC